MLKNIFAFSLVLLPHLLFSQSNTEVYLFDLNTSETGLELTNMINVSNNPGYDNQPSFIYEDILLFAGNNDGQTDIAQYNIETKIRSWLNTQTDGGEYSPQKLPSGDDVAAVRLDLDGLQRLYTYNSSNENPVMVIDGLAVAYFLFYNDNILISAVLGDGTLDLVISNLNEKTNDTLLVDVGRSIHKVPFKKSISYTAINEEKNHDLYLLDIDGNLESYFVCQLPIGVQDYIWLNETQILIGSKNKLYVYNTLDIQEWKEVASLEDYQIANITRLAVNPKGTKLAVVGEPLTK